MRGGRDRKPLQGEQKVLEQENEALNVEADSIIERLVFVIQPTHTNANALAV